MSNHTNNLVTLKDGVYFILQYDKDVDKHSVIEGKPNYFVINKKTGKIEGYGNMEIMMLAFMEDLEEKYAHFFTTGELMDVPEHDRITH